MAARAANIHGPGIPLKLLKESIGHMVVAELVRGVIVRGRLMDVQECMNLVLEDVVVKEVATTRHLPELIIRGNLLLYVVIPSKMQHSPLLTKIEEVAKQRKEHFAERENNGGSFRGRGRGRGRRGRGRGRGRGGRDRRNGGGRDRRDRDGGRDRDSGRNRDRDRR